MTTEKHTIAELLAAFEANGGSYTAAAKALGVDRRSFQRRLNRAAARGELGYNPVLPGFQITQVTNTSDIVCFFVPHKCLAIKTSKKKGDTHIATLVYTNAVAYFEKLNCGRGLTLMAV